MCMYVCVVCMHVCVRARARVCVNEICYSAMRTAWSHCLCIGDH